MRLLTDDEVRLWKLCRAAFKDEFDTLADTHSFELVLKGLREALREIEAYEVEKKRKDI
jgi:hypothetical protein